MRGLESLKLFVVIDKKHRRYDGCYFTVVDFNDIKYTVTEKTTLSRK